MTQADGARGELNKHKKYKMKGAERCTDLTLRHYWEYGTNIRNLMTMSGQALCLFTLK